VTADVKLAAQQALAKALGVSPEQVKFISMESVEWNNGCLGLPYPDEMCTEVITPGYKILLVSGGQTYEVRTSLGGSQVRVAPFGEPTPTPSESKNAAVLAARQALAKQIGIAIDQVKTVDTEKVDWPNGCLGVVLPGKMCTQMVTPGYRVTLEANGSQYEFRTNETGEIVLQATAALPKTADKVIVWEQTTGGVCSRVEIGTKSVAYGSCDGALTEAQLSAARAAELTYLLAAYQSFSTATRAGTIHFNGQGQQEASPAEMRSVAEWAKLVDMEAQGGRGGAAWGLAFTWHREGGIAGFCDDLGVYLTGWAMPGSCKGGQSRNFNPYRLTSEELTQMYAWIDQLAAFDYEHKDAASADAMQIKLSWMGAGTGQADQPLQEKIAAFAGQVYAEAVK
jgi:hypothetical protein